MNVLALPGAPPVAELAAAGVGRISVGGAFAFAALGAVVDAARELLDEGTYGSGTMPGPGPPPPAPPSAADWLTVPQGRGSVPLVSTAVARGTG